MEYAQIAIVLIANFFALICIEKLRMPQYPVGIRQYEEADKI